MGESWWPWLLILLGLLCLSGEILLPTAGLLGILAFGLISVGLREAYLLSWSIGVAATASVAPALPLTMAGAWRVWPLTPWARRMILSPPGPEDVALAHGVRNLKGLVGRSGKVETPLRPCGRVLIDGRSYQGLSESEWLATGESVTAIGSRGGQLIVRREVFGQVGLEPNA